MSHFKLVSPLGGTPCLEDACSDICVAAPERSVPRLRCACPENTGLVLGVDGTACQGELLSLLPMMTTTTLERMVMMIMMMMTTTMCLQTYSACFTG